MRGGCTGHDEPTRQEASTDAIDETTRVRSSSSSSIEDDDNDDEDDDDDEYGAKALNTSGLYARVSRQVQPTGDSFSSRHSFPSALCSLVVAMGNVLFVCLSNEHLLQTQAQKHGLQVLPMHTKLALCLWSVTAASLEPVKPR